MAARVAGDPGRSVFTVDSASPGVIRFERQGEYGVVKVGKCPGRDAVFLSVDSATAAGFITLDTDTAQAIAQALAEFAKEAAVVRQTHPA